MISCAVNGNQYIAVLAGSEMREQVLGTAPAGPQQRDCLTH
jgi:hypothetical protein